MEIPAFAKAVSQAERILIGFDGEWGTGNTREFVGGLIYRDLSRSRAIPTRGTKRGSPFLVVCKRIAPRSKSISLHLRECKAEKASGRSGLGHHSLEGCHQVVTSEDKRACSAVLIKEHKRSERKACNLLGAHRSVVRYSCVRNAIEPLQGKIKKIAYEKRRFGYRRIHRILKRGGEKINHQKIYRIYKQLGLKVLKRGGRKRAWGIRQTESPITGPNEKWALDFVQDALGNGRKIRLLPVIDVFTRKRVGIVLGTHLSADIG